MTRIRRSTLSLASRAGTSWRLCKCTFRPLARHPSSSAGLMSPIRSVSVPLPLVFLPPQRSVRVWAQPARWHVHGEAHAVVLLQGPEHEGGGDLPLHDHQPDEEQQLVFSGDEAAPLLREGRQGKERWVAAHRFRHQILPQLQSGWTNFLLRWNQPPVIIFLKKTTRTFSFRTQRSTTATRWPYTPSPGPSGSRTTQTRATWPTATPTPTRACSVTSGASPPSPPWRRTARCACCATALPGTPCTWWRWRRGAAAPPRRGANGPWWWRPGCTLGRPMAPGWWRGCWTSCWETRTMLAC